MRAGVYYFSGLRLVTQRRRQPGVAQVQRVMVVLLLKLTRESLISTNRPLLVLLLRCPPFAEPCGIRITTLLPRPIGISGVRRKISRVHLPPPLPCAALPVALETHTFPTLQPVSLQHPKLLHLREKKVEDNRVWNVQKCALEMVKKVCV